MELKDIFINLFENKEITLSDRQQYLKVLGIIDNNNKLSKEINSTFNITELSNLCTKIVFNNKPELETLYLYEDDITSVYSNTINRIKGLIYNPIVEYRALLVKNDFTLKNETKSEVKTINLTEEEISKMLEVVVNREPIADYKTDVKQHENIDYIENRNAPFILDKKYIRLDTFRNIMTIKLPNNLLYEGKDDFILLYSGTAPANKHYKNLGKKVLLINYGKLTKKSILDDLLKEHYPDFIITKDGVKYIYLPDISIIIEGLKTFIRFEQIKDGKELKALRVLCIGIADFFIQLKMLNFKIKNKYLFYASVDNNKELSAEGKKALNDFNLKNIDKNYAIQEMNNFRIYKCNDKIQFLKGRIELRNKKAP